jgi:hypothetical protein
LTVGFTVHKSEHLPAKDGQPMYADDVAEEVAAVVTQALEAWYRARGVELLAVEPTVG